MAKQIFISGGTGLIGREVVERLLQDGYDVITTTTSFEKVGDFVKYNRKLKIERIDFTDTSFRAQLAKILSESKELVAVINNARSLGFLKTDDNGFCRPEDLINEFNLDVVVPYEISIMAAEMNSNLETIINISSQYASRVPNPYLYVNLSEPSAIQYNVAKAALNKLTKELAVRFADQNIRVNSIEFGGIEGRATDTFVQGIIQKPSR